MLQTIKSLIPYPIKRRLSVFGKKHRDIQSRNRRLAKAKTIDDVRAIARDVGFTYFSNYDAQAEAKRRQFRVAVEHAGVNLKNTVVLDVGPGTADSLDTARDMGAKKTMFIDEEPFFTRFAELKGHTGVQSNYYFAPYFPAEWAGTFDFIYTKGSINCGWVDEQHAWREAGDSRGHFDFDAWLVALKKMVKPGGSIVLLPSMPRQDAKLIDKDYDLDTYFWCPDVQAYRNSYFSRTLVKHGFKISDNVPGLTQQKAFPLVFTY